MKDSLNNDIAFIMTNKGTIENVYVNCLVSETINGEYRKAATLVHTNNGKITNCIANVTFADGVEIGDNKLATIAHYNSNGGSVKNCYAVTSVSDIPTIVYQWATSEKVETVASLIDLASKTFDAADGWNQDYFAKTFKAIADLKNA